MMSRSLTSETRNYYGGSAGTPYEWAHFAEHRSQRLRKPLAKSRIALVTTAAPFQPGKGDQGPGAPYNAAAKFYCVYSGNSVAITMCGFRTSPSTASTPLPEDIGAYFPLTLLREFASEGSISMSPRGFTARRQTAASAQLLTSTGPKIVARCREDQADAAILVPNCPVCHQTVGLTARLLEENGVSTVIMGCAKDIVEFCGVPRFLFHGLPSRQQRGSAAR